MLRHTSDYRDLMIVPLGALATGSDRLACRCGSPECPAADDDGRGSNVVIHVLAEADALAAEPDPAMSGSPESPSVTMDMTLAEALAPSPEPAACRASITVLICLASVIRSMSIGTASMKPLILAATCLGVPTGKMSRIAWVSSSLQNWIIRSRVDGNSPLDLSPPHQSPSVIPRG